MPARQIFYIVINVITALTLISILLNIKERGQLSKM